MAEERIVIEIDLEDGSMKAKTDGFSGEACLSAIEKLLGCKESYTSVKPNDDFYQGLSVKETNKVGTRRN